MVERRDGADAAGQQPVDESRVERHSGRVDRPAPLRDHARPRDREPIGLEPEPGHEVEVLLEPVVVVVGDVPGVAVHDPARGVAESVPDRRAAAILMGGTLDLVGGGGRPDHKVVGEDEAGLAVVGGRHGSAFIR